MLIGYTIGCTFLDHINSRTQTKMKTKTHCLVLILFNFYIIFIRKYLSLSTTENLLNYSFQSMLFIFKFIFILKLDRVPNVLTTRRVARCPASRRQALVEVGPMSNFLRPFCVRTKVKYLKMTNKKKQNK